MIITDTCIEAVALQCAFDRSMAMGEECNSATHRFYLVRKRVAERHPGAANVSPGDFFPMYRRNKGVKGHRRADSDGDFDDMGMTRTAGEYHGWNKRERGGL